MSALSITQPLHQLSELNPPHSINYVIDQICLADGGYQVWIRGIAPATPRPYQSATVACANQT